MRRKDASSVLLILLFFKSLWNLAVAEEMNQDAINCDDDAFEEGIGSKDAVVLFFMFVFFGVVVSVFGLLLGYISFMEDSIMQEYRRKGVRVVGDVVATEFTRGVGRNDEALVKFDSQREYFVTAQYTVLLSATYPIRVRKQLRCLENEFWYPEHPDANAILSKNSQSHTIFQDPCSTCKSDTEEGGLEASLHQQSTTARIEIVTSAESFIKKFQTNQGRKLQLLVLPGHPLSALPVPQIERRLSTRHRLYSTLFIIATMTISVFCFRLASQFLLHDNMEDVSQGSESTSLSSLFQERPIKRIGLLYMLFLVGALLPLPCVHYALHNSIRNSLQEEYFESGDIIKGGLEEDSLSTWNTGTATDSFGGFKMSVGSLSTMA